MTNLLRKLFPRRQESISTSRGVSESIGVPESVYGKGSDYATAKLNAQNQLPPNAKLLRYREYRDNVMGGYLVELEYELVPHVREQPSSVSISTPRRARGYSAANPTELENTFRRR